MKRLLVHIILALENALLGIVHALLFRRQLPANHRKQGELRTILLYRTARLGDFLNAIPAMRLARDRFPQARIVLLTTTSTLQVMQQATRAYAEVQRGQLPWISFAMPELIDETYTFSFSGRKQAAAQVRRTLEAVVPDAVFMLSFSGDTFLSRLKKLVFFSMAGYRGPIYGWRMRSSLGFMRRVQFEMGLFEHQVWGPVHSLEEFPRLRKACEVDLTLRIPVREDARQWAKNLWREHGWESRHVVALFPGGTFPHKRWPVEKFAALGRTLAADGRVQLIIVGPATDTPLARQMCEQVGARCFDLTGQTNLMQLAAVFERCRLFAGNDSGPSHLADATGCPAVTLMSSIEFPGSWEPWHSRQRSVRHKVPCEGCYCYTECPLGTRECIIGITPESAAAACQPLMEMPKSASLVH